MLIRKSDTCEKYHKNKYNSNNKQTQAQYARRGELTSKALRGSLLGLPTPKPTTLSGRLGEA